MNWAIQIVKAELNQETGVQDSYDIVMFISDLKTMVS